MGGGGQGARLRSRGHAGVRQDLRRARRSGPVQDRSRSAQGADALAIVTEWREFRSPDFDDIKRALRSPVIFDGRNLYDPEHMSRAGFSYYAIGRGIILK